MSGRELHGGDDVQVAPGSHLYRRAKRRPQIVKRNQGRWELTPEAFAYDDDPVDLSKRGCSVSSSNVASQLNVPLSDVLPDWGTHGLAFFGADAVLGAVDVDVIWSPEADNAAHCLIQVVPIDKAARNEIWKPLRSRLRELAVYVDRHEALDGYPARPSVVTVV